jgi:hypothetical protein
MFALIFQSMVVIMYKSDYCDRVDPKAVRPQSFRPYNM